jgi:ligand-binding sensor domain-containing protein
MERMVMVQIMRVCLGMRSLWVCLIVLSIARPCIALDPNLSIDQYVKTSWGLKDGLVQGAVLSMSETTDGYLRLKCRFGSVQFDGMEFTALEENDGEPALHKKNSSTRINDLATDADGVQWAATPRGVVSLSKPLRRLTTDDGLLSDEVNVLMFDREGAMWVGTRGGLSRFADGEVTAYTTEHGLSNDDVTALLEDRDFNIWIGTSDGGMHRFRDGCIESATVGGSSSNGGVFSFFEDQDGALWVGTGQGLERYHCGAFTTFGRIQGFAEERLVTIEPRKNGGLYVLDAEGALYVFENGSASIVAEEGTATGDGMFDLAETSDGSLWIGGPSLMRFKDGAIERFLSPSGEITVIVEDETGLLLAARQENGLSLMYRFENNAFRQVFADMPPIHVQSIRRDKSGRLWIGTLGEGVVRIDSNNYRFYTVKEGLPHNVVYDTMEGDAGEVWVSTKKGLARIREESAQSLAGIENVPSQSPVHLTLDKWGYLFTTANDGIYRILISDLRAAADGLVRRVHAEVFGADDGLLSVEISQGPSAVAALPDGSIYYAGSRGLSVIRPDRLPAKKALPKAHIEALILDGRKYFFTNAVSVSSFGI